MSIELFFQTLFTGVSFGLMYFLVAAGLSLIYGIMHILNFAHGQLYMMGAFVFFYAFKSAGLNFFLAIIPAALAVALLGVILERTMLKPFRGDLAPSIIITLGIGAILESTAMLGFGLESKGIASPYRGVFNLRGVYLSKERLVAMAVGLAVLAALFFFVHRTKSGRAMRATEQDAEAAALMGVNIDRTASLAMGLGCALAAMAAALMSPLYYISPVMGLPIFLKALYIIILGGLGSLGGVFIGAFIIGFVDAFAGVFWGGPVAYILGFTIFIAIILVRPRGLFGHPAR